MLRLTPWQRHKLLLLLPDVLVPAFFTGNLFSFASVACLVLVALTNLLNRPTSVTSSAPSAMRVFQAALMRFLFVLPISAISMGHHYMFGTRFLLHTILSVAWGLVLSINDDRYELSNMVFVQGFILREPGEDHWIILAPAAGALWAYHRYIVKL